MLVQLKEWDEAAKAYQAIIQHQPKVLAYHLYLAAIYLQPFPPSPERLEVALLRLEDASKLEGLSQQSFLWARLAVLRLAAGRLDEYKAARTRMLEASKNAVGEEANNAAWAAAFAKDTPEGAERAIQLAVKAVSVSPQNFNYLNTYGAVLYRGGKREEAIKELEEATRQRARAYLPPDQLAYGNALDLLFKAMAQYDPAQPEPARQTLRRALRTVDGVKPDQQSETPAQSLDRVWERLEFEVLRREAESLIKP